MEHELIHGCWLWLSGLNPYTSSTHRQGAESVGGGVIMWKGWLWTIMVKNVIFIAR